MTQDIQAFKYEGKMGSGVIILAAADAVPNALNDGMRYIVFGGECTNGYEADLD